MSITKAVKISIGWQCHPERYKFPVGSKVVLIGDLKSNVHTVVSNPVNVVGLSNGKFYLDREIRLATSVEVEWSENR